MKIEEMTYKNLIKMVKAQQKTLKLIRKQSVSRKVQEIKLFRSELTNLCDTALNFNQTTI